MASHRPEVVQCITSPNSFSQAHNISIVNASLQLIGTASPKGPLPSANAIAVAGSASVGVRINRVRAEGASSGIYLVECPAAHLSMIEGHNMRGPFPRGQCVQFDKCNNSVIEDFSCENGQNISFTEDNINVFESTNVTVRRGLIDGNNSPSGDGVMFECGDMTHAYMSEGLVEDVDAINQGNGCFGGWGVSNLVFRNCRASHTHCTGQAGRGAPSSGALVFAGGTEAGIVASSGLRIEGGIYSELCKINLVWPSSAFAKVDLKQAAFNPRDPIRLGFCWLTTTGA